MLYSITSMHFPARSSSEVLKMFKVFSHAVVVRASLWPQLSPDRRSISLLWPCGFHVSLSCCPLVQPLSFLLQDWTDCTEYRPRRFNFQRNLTSSCIFFLPFPSHTQRHTNVAILFIFMPSHTWPGCQHSQIIPLKCYFCVTNTLEDFFTTAH